MVANVERVTPERREHVRSGRPELDDRRTVVRKGRAFEGRGDGTDGEHVGEVDVRGEAASLGVG